MARIISQIFMVSFDRFFVVLVCFFVFKQKTAYELRFIDWSSDVCSSDLSGCALWQYAAQSRLVPSRGRRPPAPGPGARSREDEWLHEREYRRPRPMRLDCPKHACRPKRRSTGPESRTCRLARDRRRSEEPTSELQSLMRNSYAAFCLKKKK